MNNRFNSRHRVWLFLIFALVFTLAACERPLNEKDEAATESAIEEASGESTMDGELPEEEPAAVIVPPTPETVPPTGEVEGATENSDGTSVDVPVEEVNQTPEDGTGEESAQPEAETPVEETVPEQVHIVQAGDNLYRIGLQYGCTIEELAIYNQLGNPDYVDIGDEIRIPPDCQGQ